MSLVISWIDVGALEAIPRQGARVVATPRGDVAVFRTHDDGLFALDDRCPHRGGPLSQGIVHGHAVTCPLHNWVIELASGAARRPDEGCSHRHAVRLERGRVLLALPADAGPEAAGHG
ncbi:assimilatory nitrite reductase (NAD(P)H) small subunit [Tistlia consotensis]|uniref:Assimilatory nitrite reductase (NAD(P)H) small subunit n=1 Tax=Tistlia consotensis USBA 355 TaxID=560819 RepID=A0A1Y6C5Z9_9PROT|nr:nitrite reductase small subunit NirD [Tistlia consotensis]SMF36334.1 assimilatory nitrite reductase (NAD(P)H) small subunit [Tistlia consotensis USBA 355]SNR71706.1 assimilatory nitrite reductase (NAD(P)H) small subunit [Tistlia consotensis]